MPRFPDVLRTIATFAGFGLVILGGAKLSGVDTAIRPLASLGLGDPWIPWIARGEIVVGVLLAHPPLQRVGGWAAVAWMAGAGFFHLRAGDVAGALLPGALLAFGLALASMGPRFDLERAIPTPLTSAPRRGLYVAFFIVNLVGLAFMFRWAAGGVLYWAALPVMGLAQAARSDGRESGTQAVLLYMLVLGFGVSGIWNFVGHFFMSDFVAASVGWPSGSPFQEELAFYHLGSGIAGLLCMWWRDRFWIAAALAPSAMAYGAAFIHLREFLVNQNTSPANWGVGPVGANALIPTVILILLIAYAKGGGFAATAPGR